MAKDSFLDSAYQDRSDDETRAFYDEWATSYDADMDTNDYAQPRRCAEALSALLSNKRARILDIGCGTGRSGVGLRAAGYINVDGCDYSEEMLKRAETTGAYGRVFQANLNAPPLDVADEGYSGATCIGVFSFGHVSVDALDDILRIVKPGGPIIIGLNELFYAKGELTRKLEALEATDKLEIIAQEKGSHLPGEGLEGWVLSLRKC